LGEDDVDVAFRLREDLGGELRRIYKVSNALAYWESGV